MLGDACPIVDDVQAIELMPDQVFVSLILYTIQQGVSQTVYACDHNDTVVLAFQMVYVQESKTPSDAPSKADTPFPIVSVCCVESTI